MIVRDTGDGWQIVLQTDHASLAGKFAEAWGNSVFAKPDPRASVVTATTRHDDGWAVWERAPSLLTEDGQTRPRNFLDVQVQLHLAFYRTMIASVLDDDRYAGLLVSMHGAGIYTGRYGTDPQLKLTFARDEQQQVDSFVKEQEDRYDEIAGELGIDDDERWTNYKLVQVCDRLSLYFCMVDMQIGKADVIEPVPVDYRGEEVVLEITPDGPWRVRMDPFPFGTDPVMFDLSLRWLPKVTWPNVEAFRSAFFDAAVIKREVVIEPG